MNAGKRDPLTQSSGASAGTLYSGLMSVEEVQTALNRSRASIYRYANTDPTELNPPYDPQKLNPELRTSDREELQFHSNEVARFARDVLKIKEVHIEVIESPQTRTEDLLRAILQELQSIHELLKKS